jgi:hypothetical protein
LQPMWPASSIASLQTRLCAMPTQSLHGPAVVGVDLVADVLMHAACPATPRSTLGGSDAANSRIGVPCALRSSNDKTGTVCWHAAREIVRSEPMPPAQRLAHPQRVRVRTPLVSVPFSTTLAAGEVLVVTQHRMEWAATGAWKVNLSDGMETHAVAPWWRAYACRADAKAGCWVEGLVETNDARGVDVSVVRSE